jgi:high-affinity iron transporter
MVGRMRIILNNRRQEVKPVLYSFIITLREGLEAALIIGILVAYLSKANRRESIPPVLWGATGAILVSLAGGLALRQVAASLQGAAMELFEGTMMLTAAAMLTYVILWMQREARHLQANLHGRLTTALGTGSALALVTLAFTVVVREGLETVLFLIAGLGAADQPLLYLLGALGGALAAALLGVLLYRGAIRLDLRRFFGLTGWLLTVFAAGMLANGFKEFHEAGVVPRVVSHVWDSYHLLPDTTALGRMLAALLGYDASPSLVQVAAYFGYLLLVGSFMLRGRRPRGHGA